MVDIPREKRRSRYALKGAAAAALLVAGVAGFCRLEPAAPRVAARSLYIGTVRSGRMVVEVRGAGTLAAEHTAWIPAPADGRVERILVQPGTAVRHDTIVMELVSAELAQAAADAMLQVRAAEAELRSLRTDLRSEILTQEAVVAAARAQDEEARHRARADAELAQAGLLSALTFQASRGRGAAAHREGRGRGEAVGVRARARGGELVMDLIRTLHGDGATVVMVTHDPRYAVHAGRRIELFDGRLVAAAPLLRQEAV